jgi:RNA polymerase subunit RPABC4/transcription elongation factor Spt4
MKKCKDCGYEVADDATVCPLDGGSLEEVMTILANPSLERRTAVPGKAGDYTEHEGSKCVKCGTLFFSKVERCSRCQSDVQPANWYSRICIERIAFILVGTVAFSILGSFSTNGDTKLAAVGFVPALYVLAYQFMGVRFTESFATVPPNASQAFSWARFLKEGVVLGTIFLVVAAAIALRAFLRWNHEHALH